MQLSRDELLSAYRTMATARHFEDSVFENFSDGKIPGFVHLSAGQEATAAGVYMSLDERDWIATTHRAHGQCIARGLDLQETMDEIYGASSGVCGGKGGSMHIADLDKGMLGANGIIGATGPLAVGAGLSARAKGENGVAVAFYGDGGSNQGLIFEAQYGEYLEAARDGRKRDYQRAPWRWAPAFPQEPRARTAWPWPSMATGVRTRG